MDNGIPVNCQLSTVNSAVAADFAHAFDQFRHMGFRQQQHVLGEPDAFAGAQGLGDGAVAGAVVEAVLEFLEEGLLVKGQGVAGDEGKAPLFGGGQEVRPGSCHRRRCPGGGSRGDRSGASCRVLRAGG